MFLLRVEQGVELTGRKPGWNWQAIAVRFAGGSRHDCRITWAQGSKEHLWVAVLRASFLPVKVFF
jgi:hypothetical protein